MKVIRKCVAIRLMVEQVEQVEDEDQADCALMSHIQTACVLIVPVVEGCAKCEAADSAKAKWMRHTSATAAHAIRILQDINGTTTLDNLKTHHNT